MTLNVKYNNTRFPAGTVWDVRGLAPLTNNVARDVALTEEQKFTKLQGTVAATKLAASADYTVTGVALSDADAVALAGTGDPLP